MQPYFFPYIGYWQLIDAVDEYVIYDDVNFINRGWVNRNKILINGESKYINLLLHKASQNKLINEIELLKDTSIQIKFLSTLKMAYSKAPYFQSAYPIIEQIINLQETNLSKFLLCQIRTIMEYLHIKTKIWISSEMEKDNSLKGCEKIRSICKLLGANHYINAIGGKSLYSKDDFQLDGIELQFLKTKNIIYPQFGLEFLENLSIIDVMMFNSVQKIREMLKMYVLE